MNLRKAYESTALRLLGKFQLIEFALKHYIGFSYELIHKKVSDTIHFGQSIKDVEQHPLGRLITIFSKLNDNFALHKQLVSLQASRDHLAHRSLLLTAGGRYDIATLEKANEDFSDLEDDVDECLHDLLGELRRVKEALYGSAA